jgi:hypothetical protein
MAKCLSVSLLIFGASALQAGDIPAELQQCREETEDSRRLACFDRELAKILDVASASSPTAAASSKTAEQRFGFRGDVARSAIDNKRNAEPALERLQAKVTSVRIGPTGYWTVTLDNGQEWAQVPMGVRVSIKVGDSVTIVPLSLGSFSLVPQSGPSARVRRRQ